MSDRIRSLMDDNSLAMKTENGGYLYIHFDSLNDKLLDVIIDRIKKETNLEGDKE